MEVSSKSNPDCWRVEHLDKELSSQTWVTWKHRFTYNQAIQRLLDMTRQELPDYYVYRIRNIDTDEIIPGELFHD